MLDENRTEASREGALNAYESLFGDTVAEASGGPHHQDSGEAKPESTDGQGWTA